MERCCSADIKLDVFADTKLLFKVAYVALFILFVHNYLVIFGSNMLSSIQGLHDAKISF